MQQNSKISSLLQPIHLSVTKNEFKKKTSKLVKLSTKLLRLQHPPTHFNQFSSPPNHSIQGTKRRTATACGHALVEGLLKEVISLPLKSPKKKTKERTPLANHTPKKLTNHPSGQQELLLLVKFQAIFVGWNETIRLEGPVTSVLKRNPGKMWQHLCLGKYVYVNIYI